MHRSKQTEVEVGENFVRIGKLVMKHPDHIIFVTACIEAGLTPYEYRGRFAYIGPGVTLPDRTDICRLKLDMDLEWDNLGKQFVFHPAVSANEKDEKRIEMMKYLRKLQGE